jgi:hypothetical protein
VREGGAPGDLALDARALAFKAEIERRLASGPATPMDFSEVKRRIRAEVPRQPRVEAMFARLDERVEESGPG